MANRSKKLAGIGVVGLLVLAVGIYFLFFRGSAPASVESAEAEQARAEAVAAAEAEGGPDDEGDAEGGSVDEGETELDSGQPDSAASVGAATDGVWSVDTSIGTFDESCLTEVCGSNFVGFRIDEELASFGAKTVVGRTPEVTGSMELVGNMLIGAEFVANLQALITDDPGRNNALRGEAGGLETDAFPEARFELTQAVDLGELPAEGASIQFEATGNLTVHGVTNEVTVPLTAELQAGVIIVFGELPGLLLSDFDIPTPRALVVVSVEDNATMELQLFLSR